MTVFSYQLYSSREFPPLDQTLKMLADAGYKQVEGFRGVFDRPEETRAQLDAAGLSMTSAHFSMDALENDLDGVFDIAGKLGVSSLYCPYLDAPERPDDLDGWKAFAGRLQNLAGPARDAGFEFGWHNHDFEFEPLPDGTVPQQIILEDAPDIKWEADIAWIAVAGADPIDWISRYGDRITAVHIKDKAPAGECADEDGWADVGHGTLDWAGYFRELKTAPVKHWIMEHDKPADDKRFATRSIEAARQFAAGLAE